MKKMKKVLLGVLLLIFSAFLGVLAVACGTGGTTAKYSLVVDKKEVEYGETITLRIEDTSLYSKDIYYYADSDSAGLPNQVAWNVYEFTYVVKEDTTFYMSYRGGYSNNVKVKVKPLTGIELTANKTTVNYGETITLTATTSEGNEVYCTNYYVIENGVERKLDGNTCVLSAPMANFYAKHETGVESRKITVNGNVQYVSTAEQLKAMAEDWYVLDSNINLHGENWKPLSTFKGCLIGRNFTISNFSISANDNNAGFFAKNEGVIDTVWFRDVKINSLTDKSKIGLIAGENAGTIKNCRVYGEISAKYASSVGGLVGLNVEKGKIVDCENHSPVEGGKNVGGIVGHNEGRIENCENKETVVGKGQVGGVVGIIAGGTCLELKNAGEVKASGANVGGVAGQILATDETKGLHNKGKVENTGSDTGGLVGHLASAKVSEFTQTAEVKGANSTGGLFGACAVAVAITSYENTVAVSGTTNVGGLVGWAKEGTTITDCKNKGTVKGHCYLGGIVGGEKATLKNCINNGEIINEVGLTVDNVLSSFTGGVAGVCNTLETCKNTVNVKGVGAGVGGVVARATSVVECENSGEVVGVNTVGGVVGYPIKTAKDCKNYAPVSGTSAVGGIAGYGSGANFSGLFNGGTVRADGDRVGGIVGSFNDYASCSSCVNEGQVVGKNRVGGIVGHTQMCVEYSALENKGEIQGEAEYVGGLIGYGAWTTVSSSRNRGNVLGVNNVGGIGGYLATLIVVTECENFGEINGKQKVGGIVGLAIGIARVHGGGYYKEGFDMSACVNEGTITGDNHVGGILGRIEAQLNPNFDNTSAQGSDNITVKACENKGAVNGSGANVGGIDGSRQNASMSWKYWGWKYAYLNVVIDNSCVNSGKINGVDPTE